MFFLVSGKDEDGGEKMICIVGIIMMITTKETLYLLVVGLFLVS